MAIGTVRTASEVHGTGADTILLGILWISHLGDTVGGMTTGISAAGTIHTTTAASMEDGTTHGTGEAIGVGTTHGTVHTIADGMEDGTLIGDITIIMCMVQDTLEESNITRMHGMAQDTRQVPTECSQAESRQEEA